MYSTCLFCLKDLGSNVLLETLPIGRRLGFDPEKGRLWVICRHCDRWNLTPFEERWEAIEACERLYRGTRLRVSTEHIGLARIVSGLDLVRVGRPSRPEFAAWRYGDQLGRRRRRNLWRAGLGLGALGGVLAGGAAMGIGLGGSAWILGELVDTIIRGSPNKVLAQMPSGPGSPTRIRRKHLPRLRLHADDAGGWTLSVRKHKTVYTVRDDEALRLAGSLFPHLNHFGGTRARVEAAVRELEAVSDPLEYFARVATRPGGRSPAPVAKLPVPVRLALEMAAHEEAERRAAEGELAALQRAWREAEEIAAIADGLLIPASVDAFIRKHRRGRLHPAADD